VNDLYKENYKLLKKEMKEDYRKWRDLPCSWIDSINIVKLYTPKVIHMFNAIPIKIPMTFTKDIEKSTIKYMWKHKRLRIAKTILNQKNNDGRIMIPDFKLYCKALTIKTAWYLHKNRHEDQWNRIEDPDIKPQNYNQLAFEKGTKNKRWRKSRLFNKNCWKNWLAVCKTLKLDPCISPYNNINSKWNKDLNIRPQTLKLVQERVGYTLELIGICKNFQNRTPAAQQLRDCIDKWDFIKLKTSPHQKKRSLN
jgi:hypothetical protein